MTFQSNIGVAGYAPQAGAIGVYSTSYSGTGVMGSSSATNDFGVRGHNLNGTATYGESRSGIGVQGVSQTDYGVAGFSGGIGVYGLSSGSYGIVGVTGSITTAPVASFAAYFTGKVSIDGAFSVNGTQRFTLKHSDGTKRLVHGMQSPEAWVEDVGKGTLVVGRWRSPSTRTSPPSPRRATISSSSHRRATPWG